MRQESGYRSYARPSMDLGLTGRRSSRIARCLGHDTSLGRNMRNDLPSRNPHRNTTSSYTNHHYCSLGPQRRSQGRLQGVSNEGGQSVVLWRNPSSSLRYLLHDPGATIPPECLVFRMGHHHFDPSRSVHSLDFALVRAKILRRTGNEGCSREQNDQRTHTRARGEKRNRGAFQETWRGSTMENKARRAGGREKKL